jgi:hypothetical protein
LSAIALKESSLPKSQVHLIYQQLRTAWAGGKGKGETGDSLTKASFLSPFPFNLFPYQVNNDDAIASHTPLYHLKEHPLPSPSFLLEIASQLATENGL